MKKNFFLFLVGLIFLFSSCTVHFPYGWDGDHYDYRVILLVQPDDADVLLDGKFIGEAYEFSNLKSALRLPSRNHELVIKKNGYVEEVIDLYEYSTHDITIRLKLLKDKRHYSSPEKKKKKEVKEVKSEYIAKTEPEKEPPAKVEEDIEKVKSVNVTLEILPKESSIYLNGKFWGISPESGKIENLRLKPGKYALEIVKPGYKGIKKQLYVKDKDIKISIRLQK